MDLYEELARLIDELNQRSIDYAVIGGIAVAIHGYARFTKDIDLLVRREDLDHVREVVRSLGFTLDAGIILFEAGTARAREVSRISKIEGRQLLTLDLVLVTPVFEDVWSGRKPFRLQQRELQVVSREGLRKMKLLAGRDQDLLDLSKLGLHDDTGTKSSGS